MTRAAIQEYFSSKVIKDKASQKAERQKLNARKTFDVTKVGSNYEGIDPQSPNGGENRSFIEVNNQMEEGQISLGSLPPPRHRLNSLHNNLSISNSAEQNLNSPQRGLNDEWKSPEISARRNS